MFHLPVSARAMKFALAIVAALAASACAKNGDESQFGAGAGTPGSQQDFTTNVGDRVFFETDSSELTPTAQATLSKQAAWLTRYANYSFTIEGNADERGTRDIISRLALGAPRPRTTSSSRKGSRPRACARFPTARNVRSRLATTSPAGRRIVAPSRCSPALRPREAVGGRSVVLSPPGPAFSRRAA